MTDKIIEPINSTMDDVLKSIFKPTPKKETEQDNNDK